MKKLITITVLILLATSLVLANPIEVFYGSTPIEVPWISNIRITFMSLTGRGRINYTGTITKVEWYKSDTSSFLYGGEPSYPTIINIGMTKNDKLDRYFENNYLAGSKKEIGRWAEPYETPAQSGWYDILLGKNMRYDYNKNYNLILYVTYNGNGKKSTPLHAGNYNQDHTLWTL